MIFKIIFFSILIFSFKIMANEQLLKVKAVSNSKKTFIISLGATNGIYERQTAIFYNNNVSVRAQAIEVNRFNSLWKVLNKKLKLPFTTGEIISYDSGFTNLSVKFTQFNDLSKSMNKFNPKSKWLFQTNIGFGLNQKIDGVPTSSISSSSALGFEFGKYFNYFPNISAAYTLIYSKSNVTQSSALSAVTNREMAAIKLYYLFENVLNSKHQMYLSNTIAYGFSQTSFGTFSLSGSAIILPKIEFGVIRSIENSKSITLSISYEQITTNETFSDGLPQGSVIQNISTAIGILF